MTNKAQDLKEQLQEINEKLDQSFKSLCDMYNANAKISAESTKIINKLQDIERKVNDAFNEYMEISDKFNQYALNKDMALQYRLDRYIKHILNGHTKEEAIELANKDLKHETSAINEQCQKAQQEYQKINHETLEQRNKLKQEHKEISEILKDARNKYNNAYEQDKELRNTQDNLRAQLYRKRERNLLIYGLFATIAIIVVVLTISACTYVYPIPTKQTISSQISTTSRRNIK